MATAILGCGFGRERLPRFKGTAFERPPWFVAAALDQSGLFVTTAATVCYGATALIRGCDFCTLAASTVRDYRSLVESGWREWWKPSQGQIWPFALSVANEGEKFRSCWTP